jgi:hypothetical protein
MTYGNTRAGRGRWTAIMRPSIGILWTDDDDNLGFHQTSNVVVDPTPVLALIDNAQAAGKSATECFDELVLAIGSRVDIGNLDNWKAERGRIRLR